jgi:hypothetical protein
MIEELMTRLFHRYTKKHLQETDCKVIESAKVYDLVEKGL